MKGCHFKHKGIQSCYEAEALKDNVWYGLVYSPDENIYYWESEESGAISDPSFELKQLALDWIFDVEKFITEEKMKTKEDFFISDYGCEIGHNL